MTIKLCRPLLSFLSLILFCYRFGIVVVHGSKEEQLIPFKTFKTEFGEIIDCVDILKQPAFNHPLLKDHKIQKRPSHYPDGWIKPSGEEQRRIAESLGFVQQCPDGTIPVRRNTNGTHDDRDSRRELLQSGEPLPGQIKYYILNAVLQIKQSTRFLGAHAVMDVQYPKCRDAESSGAFIWLSDGADQKITVGWTVDPRLYGDDQTHFSTYWSGGAGKPGCYDLRCPGFVQVDKSFTLGSVLPRVAVPRGQRFAIYVNVYQDQGTKNWWLVLEKPNVAVGYWPNGLFSGLTNGASRLDFGGRVAMIPGLPSPKMGSGVLADGKTSGVDVSFFKQISYRDSNNMLRIPDPDAHDTTPFVNCPQLYGLRSLFRNSQNGAYFLYGGPGGDSGLCSAT